MRYGNSIKTVLGDFEKVKAKLVVPDYKLQLETLRLKGKLVASDFHDTMKDDIEKIKNALDIKGLTTEQLDMYENQINFLSFLSKIMKSGKRQIEHLARIRRIGTLLLQRTSLEMLEITLLAPALALKKRIMVLRSRFSDQEKEEIHDELLRFSLIWSFRLLCNALEQKDIYVDLSHIASVIESDQKISKWKMKLTISLKTYGNNYCYLFLQRIKFQCSLQDIFGIIIKIVILINKMLLRF